MKQMKPVIHENGMDHVRVGACYAPAKREPEEKRPIGKWGVMQREYLEDTDRETLDYLLQSGKLDSFLADVNEQANERFQLIVKQMMEAEGVTETMKRVDQMKWVRSMNSIVNRAEEIIKTELIYR